MKVEMVNALSALMRSLYEILRDFIQKLLCSAVRN